MKKLRWILTALLLVGIVLAPLAALAQTTTRQQTTAASRASLINAQIDYLCSLLTFESQPPASQQVILQGMSPSDQMTLMRQVILLNYVRTLRQVAPTVQRRAISRLPRSQRGPVTRYVALLPLAQRCELREEVETRRTVRTTEQRSRATQVLRTELQQQLVLVKSGYFTTGTLQTIVVSTGGSGGGGRTTTSTTGTTTSGGGGGGGGTTTTTTSTTVPGSSGGGGGGGGGFTTVTIW